MRKKLLTRRELWIVHIAPFLLGLTVSLLAGCSIELANRGTALVLSSGYPFRWFYSATVTHLMPPPEPGLRPLESWSEFSLPNLVADAAIWTAVSLIGTLGVLAFKTRLKVAWKSWLWVLHLAPLTLGVIITLSTWLVVSTYLPTPAPRMPIFTTYRGYPVHWLQGIGNPGEEPLAWIFQLENFIADIAFWSVLVSIGALVIYWRNR
mgnify:CR=1 FL=1